MRPSQCIGDVVGTKCLLPDRGAQSAVFLKWLVHHIPLPDLAPKMADFREDMLLEDVRKLRIREGAAGYPGRQLVVPDQIVAANELMMLAGETNLVIGWSIGENSALSFYRSPLHLVFRGDGRELLSEDLSVLGIAGQR